MQNITHSLTVSILVTHHSSTHSTVHAQFFFNFHAFVVEPHHKGQVSLKAVLKKR